MIRGQGSVLAYGNVVPETGVVQALLPAALTARTR
jgi:hypothetical protein